MLLLDRYIAKIIIQAIIVAMLLIAGIAAILTILAELKNLGHGDYRLLQLLSYVVMQLPIEVYHDTPMIMLLGTIAGLGALTRNNELIVMRALGMTPLRMVCAVISATLIMIVMVTIIGETIGPKLSTMAVIQRDNARSGGHAILTKSGVWFHIDNDFIHIKQIISKHLLQDVTRYEFDHSRHLIAVYAADKLIHRNDKIWYLEQVKKTGFFPEHTTSESMSSLPWHVKLNTELFNDIIEPSEMPLVKVRQFIHYLKQNGLQASEYEFAFWQRLMQPLVNIVMVLIAIPFAFNLSYRNQYGKQLIIGILLGISLFITDAFLEQVCIVYQFPAWAAATLPLAILSGISYYFLRKALQR